MAGVRRYSWHPVSWAPAASRLLLETAERLPGVDYGSSQEFSLLGREYTGSSLQLCLQQAQEAGDSSAGTMGAIMTRPEVQPFRTIDVLREGVSAGPVQSVMADNTVVTSKYNVVTFVPRSLFEQFRRIANIYFLVISVLMVLGTYTSLFTSPLKPYSTLVPLVLVLLVTMVKDGAEDLKRHRSDKRVREGWVGSKSRRTVEAFVGTYDSDGAPASLALFLFRYVENYFFLALSLHLHRYCLAVVSSQLARIDIVDIIVYSYCSVFVYDTIISLHSSSSSAVLSSHFLVELASVIQLFFA